MEKELNKFHCSNELKEQKEEILKIIDKYYIQCNEDGSYSYDPSGNQLIDMIRDDINNLDNLPS